MYQRNNLKIIYKHNTLLTFQDSKIGKVIYKIIH